MVAATVNWKDSHCFYVTVLDAGRMGLLAGPFETHEEALAMVDRARDRACEVNDRAWFYAFGTAKLRNGHRAGCLNGELGLDI